MSHQDLDVVKSRLKGQCLKVALQSLLSEVCWTPIKFRKDCSWTPKLLAAAALLWAWSDESTLVERFSVVRRIVIFLFSMQHQVAESYQAFMKILARWTDEMVGAIRVSLQQRMPRQFPDCCVKQRVKQRCQEPKQPIRFLTPFPHSTFSFAHCGRVPVDDVLLRAAVDWALTCRPK